jgi:hypothetical protein
MKKHWVLHIIQITFSVLNTLRINQFIFNFKHIAVFSIEFDWNFNWLAFTFAKANIF